MTSNSSKSQERGGSTTWAEYFEQNKSDRWDDLTEKEQEIHTRGLRLEFENSIRTRLAAWKSKASECVPIKKWQRVKMLCPSCLETFSIRGTEIGSVGPCPCCNAEQNNNVAVHPDNSVALYYWKPIKEADIATAIILQERNGEVTIRECIHDLSCLKSIGSIESFEPLTSRQVINAGRWLFLIPGAFAASSVAYVLSGLTSDFFAWIAPVLVGGGYNSRYHMALLDNAAAGGAFVYCVYRIAPSHKYVSTLIAAYGSICLAVISSGLALFYLASPEDVPLCIAGGIGSLCAHYVLKDKES